MSELKTLKDLKFEYQDGEDEIIQEKLKAEAVKWVKKDKKDILKDDSIITPIYLLKRWMKRLDVKQEDLI